MKKYINFLKKLNNKSVLILGYGISNNAIYNFIKKHCKNIIIYNDKEINNKNLIISNDMNAIINKKYDYIFRSPSVLPNSNIIIEILKFQINNKVKILTEIELFMELCESNNIIGITGSDGKTTTSTLIYKILKNNNFICWLGGNIGITMINKINKIKKEHIVILELSSFQLMNIKYFPHISVITNITPNHLDIHKSLDEYIESKLSIIQGNNNKKVIINNNLSQLISKYINIDDNNILKFDLYNQAQSNYLTLDSNKNIIFYDRNLKFQKIFNIKHLKILGLHNVENILAALLTTYEYCKFNNVYKTIFDFTGINHRIEYVKTINNISFYNDSIATTPNRTIAALNSFNKKIILIAGGYDKNLSYESLISHILLKVKILILMGKTGLKIANELMKIKHNIQIYKFELLNHAVKFAYSIANKAKSDIIILSPASASFDQFKNFEERGNLFKKIVNLL